MKRSTQDYLDLITSEHKGKPRFEATVSTTVDPFVAVSEKIEHLVLDFDLDIAIGKQLDAVGERVGRSRYIPQPLPNVWLYFDSDRPNHWFDRSYWKGPFDVGSMMDRLDDQTYRRLLYAKIDANNWNGTIASAQAALDKFFTDPASHVMVIDQSIAVNPAHPLPYSSMRAIVAVSGKIPPIVDLEIFAQNLIPLKIGGVEQKVMVTSVDGARLFGFDIDNGYFGGFDTSDAVWGVDPKWLVDHLLND